MFQLGKLAIQSTVSTLGTAAIAAQAMTNILENLNGIAAIGVGVGLMTIVGQCLGAGRKRRGSLLHKEALRNCRNRSTDKLPDRICTDKNQSRSLEAWKKESADMCFHMVMWITIMKPLYGPWHLFRGMGSVRQEM